MKISSSHTLLQRAVVGFLVLSMVVLSGCGKTAKKVSLKGKVEYKNQPVTGGTITIYPPEGKGQPVGGDIKPDGTYEVLGPPTGTCKVTVSTDSVRGMSGQAYNPQMAGGQKPPGADKDIKLDLNPNMPKYVEIPNLYKDVKTTTLSVDIQPGPNTKDFTLTDTGK